jgi:class 3 adenylate cyclase
MQVSSPIPDIGAVGVADLVGLTPQQPDPLVGIVAAMRAAARAERLDDGDGRHHTARLSVARAPQFPADGQMCAVLAVDIVGFTRADRDDDIRRYLHERLYAYLQQAFDRSGAPWAECFCEDRGVGALIVMPPEIPLKGLIGCFPDKLRGLVRLHNHVSAVAADMQLRVAAHIGPVEHDGYGFVGTDVNFAFRMLDARPLKNQLAKSGAELGLIVSDYVYNSLICRYPVLADPGAFQTVRFQTKNTRTRAWTYLPGAAA